MREPDVGARSAGTRRPSLGGALFGLIGIGIVVAFGAALPAGPSALDSALRPTVIAAYPAWAATIFDGLASFPVAALLLVALAIWSWAGKVGRVAVAVVVGGLVEIPTEAVKFIVDRPRPPGATIEAIGSIAGYPSGHTVRAVVVAGLIALAFLQTRQSGDGLARAVAATGVATVAVLTGLARIASGDHWPTDVVGGAILGVAWLAVATTVSAFIARRWSVVPPSTGWSG